MHSLQSWLTLDMTRLAFSLFPVLREMWSILHYFEGHYLMLTLRGVQWAQQCTDHQA